MVTGDSLLTALYTAKGCGIIGRKYNTNIKIDKLENDKGSMDGDATSMNKAIKEEEEDDFITSTTEKNVLVLTLLNHSNNQKKIMTDSSGTKTQSGIISSSTKGDKISNKRKKKRQSLVWCDTDGNILYHYRKEKVSKIDQIEIIKNRRKTSNKNKNKNKSKEKNFSTINKCEFDIRNNHATDTENLLVSMSSRELSVLGRFDLATSGDVVSYLANKRRVTNNDSGDVKKDLKRYKRRKDRISLDLDDLRSLKYLKVSAYIFLCCSLSLLLDYGHYRIYFLLYFEFLGKKN